MGNYANYANCDRRLCELRSMKIVEDGISFPMSMLEPRLDVERDQSLSLAIETRACP